MPPKQKNGDKGKGKAVENQAEPERHSGDENWVPHEEPLHSTAHGRRVGWQSQGGPSQRVLRDILLPYLAMGIHPIETPSRGNLCGLYALLISLQTVRDAMGNDEIPADLDLQTLQDIFMSKAYEDEVEIYVQAVFDNVLGEGFKNEGDVYKAELMQRSDLDFDAIGCLLNTCNKLWKTYFVLGVINQGFWAAWLKNENPPSYNYNRETYHTVRLFANDTSVQLSPVIWIWNDNVVSQYNTWGKPGPAYLPNRYSNHWEGFGRNYNVESNARMRVINDWGFGEEIRAVVDASAYFAVRDVRLPDCLLVRRSQFVFATPRPAGFKVPRGYMYVRTVTNKQDRFEEGIVPKDRFEEVMLAGLNVPDYLTRSRASTRFEDCVQELANSMVQRDMPVFERGPTLQFYRAIDALPKLGTEWANLSEQQEIEQSELSPFPGDYFLDRQRVSRTIYTDVVAMDGKPGRIASRRLQFLRNAWGFAEDGTVGLLPALTSVSGAGDIQTTEQFARLLIKAGVPQNEIPRKKQDRLELLQDMCRRPEQLPLYRLSEPLTKEEADAETSFYANEIVRLIQSSRRQDGLVRILDYEGREGIVPRDLLEKIERPFGLRLGPQNQSFYDFPVKSLFNTDYDNKGKKSASGEKREFLDRTVEQFSEEDPEPPTKKPKTKGKKMMTVEEEEAEDEKMARMAVAKKEIAAANRSINADRRAAARKAAAAEKAEAAEVKKAAAAEKAAKKKRVAAGRKAIAAAVREETKKLAAAQKAAEVMELAATRTAAPRGKGRKRAADQQQDEEMDEVYEA